jgi:hypothetical protein
MAASGQVLTSYGKSSVFWLNWQLASQDIAGNTSTINWQYGLQVGGGNLWYSNAVRVDGGAIDGSPLPTGTWSNITGDGAHQLASGSYTMTHAADGTRSFYANLVGYLYGIGTVSGGASFTLPTIARASQPTLSASSTPIGSAVTITTNRAASSFTHIISYAFVSASGTISSSAGASVSWTLPAALANQIPGAVSGTGVITCKTYSGSTLVGTKTVNFTATVPTSAAYQPTISAKSAVEAVSGLAAKIGALVQSRSKLALSMTAAGAYGSTIKTYQITANGQTFTGAAGTTNVLTASGAQTITFKATDSRGRAVSATLSVTALAYAAPKVSLLNVKRVNSAGGEDDQGTYALVTVSAAITALNNNNNKIITLSYKKTADTSWTNVTITPASGYSLSNYQVTIANLDTESAYEFRCTVTDYFTSATVSTSLSTAFTLMDFNTSGKGMAIGKVSSGNYFEVALPLHMPPDSYVLFIENLSGDTLDRAWGKQSDAVGLGHSINRYLAAMGAPLSAANIALLEACSTIQDINASSALKTALKANAYIKYTGSGLHGSILTDSPYAVSILGS